jgi:hypothetical protein
MCKILSQEHIQPDDDVPMSQLYTMSSKMKSAFYVIRREDLQAVVEMYPKEVPPLHVTPHIVFTAVLVPQIHTLCRRVYDLEKDTLNHLGIQVTRAARSLLPNRGFTLQQPLDPNGLSWL